MNIHEYQAKEIFASYKIPTLKGKVAFSVDEAVANAKELGGSVWAVKAQIHAGGRGLGGGVKIAKNLDEVKSYASQILGMNLVTHQTGPEGKLVQKLYIESGANIVKEYYLAILFNRMAEKITIIASSEGGMDIEKVAKESPDKIAKVSIDPQIGFKMFHGLEVSKVLGLNKDESKKLISMIDKLYKLYMDKDMNMLEINPLIKTAEGDFYALDAKCSFDDSGLYRNQDIATLRDISEENPAEREASEFGLSYVKLDGDVACMVNGAGLAMATMDIINYSGAKPANFLDVGGGASAETVAKAFEIILRDKNVKVIFINIFGGIVRCDRIANGILEATKNVEVNVPVVVRLDGTNAAEAKAILENSNLTNVKAATDLKSGAELVKSLI
ncbi:MULTISPECIES: ADP-forming succinate--CoA ligase subunit beta [unclassified Campylobacter]|uniref:ADP-forming succinate--CoA ligase subunit beta n=1 Tax=unclassified Campylobacter TaxID=2593542 RepID=UPI001238113B|nr:MULTISPECIES: ADP-forming succinate--CoA ligase subunit beta [unclassified Campylobacter]KAA6225515.1 ADP-forming succinate--CoA ligase subunit beta [Campylobacter sp. LR196d]KAA6226952.1 ADP-forming succinate--CoA ligase subunit beta [Campylobacter sp. LR185c]KAA6229786.1 ADP-forming succinate--CoA ligase subunit beta [Campylobacter sp. LR286c]KAA6234311.1 ADP-forming succinate--CoA ligase subunit beta [Campylobacter sp. LR291e]KAA6234530.1 ADP-forming succinate--CoA ligase subunit beta [C